MKQWLCLGTATREKSMNKDLTWKTSTLEELTMAAMVAALEAWTQMTYLPCSWALKWVEWEAIPAWAEVEVVAVAEEEPHQASHSNFNEKLCY
jgi:hypothetical protein